MKQKNRYAYFFILPGTALLIMFTILAALLAFAFSFMDFNLLRPQDAAFIGLENYRRLVTDGSFLKAIKNTVYFAVVVVPYQVGMAFGLALLVRRNIRGVGIFRSAYFCPACHFVWYLGNKGCKKEKNTRNSKSLFCINYGRYLYNYFTGSHHFSNIFINKKAS